MAIREIDAISDAVIETEREIAGEAWGEEDTERADATGDRALESMGDGLEGQHEPEEDDTEGDDLKGDEETGEGEGDGEAGVTLAADKGKTGADAPVEPKPGGYQPEGRVPPGRYREAAERARAAEAERDALKAQLDAKGNDSTKITALEAQLAQLTQLLQGQRQAPPVKTAEPPVPEKAPDIFEDPEGFKTHMQKGFQAELAKRDQQLAAQRVETSMAIAHAFHKDAFTNAFAAINKLDPNNPDDRTTVARIYNSPNPGEALVTWHKRQETLREVGEDPAAFRENVRKETRESLMKDPEFRKALLADMRAEAANGDNGTPRTTNRLPPNLHRAAGSNLGVDRGNSNAFDDSDQAVAESAWR